MSKTPSGLQAFVEFWHMLRVKWRAFRIKRRWSARLLYVMLGIWAVYWAIKLVFLTGVFGEIPTVSKLRHLNMENAASVYSADGKLLGRYYTRNRTSTTFDQLPDHLIKALIATEDARFYYHSGVDYVAMVRVLLKTLLRGDESSGGGSTLSQQVAKNLFPRRDHPFLSTPINKFREMIIAKRLERAHSKEKILEIYLNTVPFPDNVFGIEVAARRFFSVPPKDLNIVEGATLVGTLKATSYFNPRRFPDRAKERRNMVLQLMHEHGYLSKERLVKLSKQPIELRYTKDFMLKEGRASHFREYLRIKVLPEILDSLGKRDNTTYDLYTDGLKIYTTLDSRLQEHAEQAVKKRMVGLQQTFDNHWADQIPWLNDTILMEAFKKTPRYRAIKYYPEEKIEKIINAPQPMTIFTYGGEKDVMMSPLDSFKHYFKLLNAGFLAMSPQTGEVKAWVGGYDFNFNQYDQVRARRSVGSTFKPIVYAAALEAGISPCEPIPNRKVVWHKYDTVWMIKDWSRRDPRPNIDKATGKDLNDWNPDNADRRYGGYYSMEGALSNSVNVATVHLIMRIGVWPVLKMARLLGIESPIPPEPSIALGSADLTLLEMVSAFGTFPNRGRHAPPMFITRIEKADGTVLAEFKPPHPGKLKQVMSPDNADAMTRMLQAVTDGGTAGSLRWKYNIDSDMAGKTGTSQNHSDGWFIGFTPHLVAGSYVGAISPAVRFRDLKYGQGSFTALPIWGLFMSNVLKDPNYASWVNVQFKAPAPHVLDSLKCSHRPWPKLTEEQLQAIRNRVLVDSLGNPVIGDPQKLNLPELPRLDEEPPGTESNGR